MQEIGSTSGLGLGLGSQPSSPGLSNGGSSAYSGAPERVVAAPPVTRTPEEPESTCSYPCVDCGMPTSFEDSKLVSKYDLTKRRLTGARIKMI